MTTFTEADHARLATLFDGECNQPGGCRNPAAHHEPYAGYKPEVREAPNGDTKACPGPCDAAGRMWRDNGGHFPCRLCNGTGRVPNIDAGLAGKRYLHVALKYDPPAWALEYLARAHFEACRVAEALGVPAAYYPRVADGTLRVIEYPSAGHTYSEAGHCIDCRESNRTARGVCPTLAPGAGTAEHTDPNLFTIVLWRSHPADLERGTDGRNTWYVGKGPGFKQASDAETLSPGLHIGAIGELVGLGPATPHRVPARPYAQKSLVYFSVPDHAALLPDGRTVGAFLYEWKKRSRVYA